MSLFTEAELSDQSLGMPNQVSKARVSHLGGVDYRRSASRASSTPRWCGVDSASCVWLRITVSILAICCSTSWR